MSPRKSWLAFLATNPPCECGNASRGSRCTTGGWIRCNARLRALSAWEQTHGSTTPTGKEPT